MFTNWLKISEGWNFCHKKPLLAWRLYLLNHKSANYWRWNQLRSVFLHWRCYRGFTYYPNIECDYKKYCGLTTTLYYFRHLTWLNLVPITADYFVVWFYFNIRSRRLEVFSFFFNIAPWQLTQEYIVCIFRQLFGNYWRHLFLELSIFRFWIYLYIRFLIVCFNSGDPHWRIPIKMAGLIIIILTTWTAHFGPF